MIPGARLYCPISPSSIMNFVEKGFVGFVYTQDNLSKIKTIYISCSERERTYFCSRNVLIIDAQL